ncbi:MAG: hypothetical protein EAZ92_15085 [Candidatus Kapaibacterium sp.]|nr:MAG: hypothetical protein EAZ92_15085 [Candidatus Kapabacteria bacterium]
MMLPTQTPATAQEIEDFFNVPQHGRAIPLTKEQEEYYLRTPESERDRAFQHILEEQRKHQN